MELCARLKHERERLQLTQMLLAKASGIRQEHWSRMETGNLPVNLKALTAIAELGGDVHYILTDQRRLPSIGDLRPDERGLLKLLHAVQELGGLDALGQGEACRISTRPSTVNRNV
ncbi:hypothetical protein A8U91_03941 [Halomonas elongata]|uniref:HTH cro/C1-type domain-containing protein n=1 Tax=Halomonas elongata TaxID=2746 RepID=A0A1B8NY30_HALEL|nr:helix-turn-helix transcriptional regulator [Halomonas elongata]OBX34878.1 hypothetical protein A8U91_03941 [Halomonas elongata]